VIHDSNKNSCLFSVDLKEHMVPMDSKNLIQCFPDLGPTFGAGYDLCISDECNVNNSKANFPTTYNIDGKSKYVSGQDSYRTFSGATQNDIFRVTEYEVFRVVY